MNMHREKHIAVLSFLVHTHLVCTVADKGKQRPKTFPLGETCCSYRNDANSKIHMKIQNQYNNGNVLQMNKTCCKKPKQIH